MVTFLGAPMTITDHRETKIQCSDCSRIGWVRNYHDNQSGFSVALRILGNWQLRQNPLDSSLFEAYCPEHRRPEKP